MADMDKRKNEVLTVLGGILDAGRGVDIVQAGMVSGLELSENEVCFALTIDAARMEEMEEILAVSKQAIEKIGWVKKCTIIMTAPKKGEKKPIAPMEKEVFANMGAIIAVASAKGGVGKSTIAANLALALSKAGQKTGLLDADIYGPSLPSMFGVANKPVLDKDKKLIPMEKGGIKSMSIGYMVPETQAMVWRGPMVQGALLQMFKDVAWGKLDVLVLDMPPGTGDIQLTMAQKIPVTAALLISTPQELALADLRRNITMFSRLGIPILGLVENMAWMETPKGEKLYPFGKGKNIAKKLRIENIAQLPLLSDLQQKKGELPFMAEHGKGETADIFQKMAEKLLATLKS